MSARALGGTAWLADASLRPSECYAAWHRDEFAAIPAGSRWDVVEANLQRSVAAMQHLSRRKILGPVMVYPEADRAWWLVPLGAEEHLADVAALTVQPQGWLLRCPPADRYMHGRGWLEKPDGSGLLTDATALSAVFWPGGTLTAEVTP
jgi:hypothetical protein